MVIILPASESYTSRSSCFVFFDLLGGFVIPLRVFAKQKHRASISARCFA